MYILDWLLNLEEQIDEGKINIEEMVKLGHKAS